MNLKISSQKNFFKKESTISEIRLDLISYLLNQKKHELKKITDSLGLELYINAIVYNKEVNEFLESMNSSQFKKIEEFFTTMPKLSHKLKVKRILKDFSKLKKLSMKLMIKLENIKHTKFVSKKYLNLKGNWK